MYYFMKKHVWVKAQMCCRALAKLLPRVLKEVTPCNSQDKAGHPSVCKSKENSIQHCSICWYKWVNSINKSKTLWNVWDRGVSHCFGWSKVPSWTYSRCAGTVPEWEFTTIPHLKQALPRRHEFEQPGKQRRCMPGNSGPRKIKRKIGNVTMRYVDSRLWGKVYTHVRVTASLKGWYSRRLISPGVNACWLPGC